MADVEREIQAPGVIQPRVRYRLGGLYEQQRIAFTGLAWVFAAAVAAEFALMLFLYESL
ncbi:hypothetical protein [Dankookia rubra]|uniref:hypothetical protein n=1 Tax=Dankookia rubra TaxID=1442381 RepID=UPI001F4F3243|nr:hypothetical protein [Dankookia rubra]